MSIVFCNVGWMEKYQGIHGDAIARGGSYNQHSIGHEVCNFCDVNGIVYGYVQTTGQIKVEKLGADQQAESIDGVTVVWTAGPPDGGTVIVGWYKDATVYRGYQRFGEVPQMQAENGISNYIIKAPAASATLLPVDERKFLIPRAVKGGIGQNNVWYAQKPESAELVSKVRAMIETEGMPRIPDVDFYLAGIEGTPRLATHLRRERDISLVKAKKKATLKAMGKLCCEACGFDFAATYGEIGRDFCEVHHLKPLAEANGTITTQLHDLAILCSNCHRIIHRTNPMFLVAELSKIVRDNKR